MRPYAKSAVRLVTDAKARFASLAVIAMLGTMSVVGIQAASIDMRDVADRTYKGRGLYDVQVRSAAGFGEGDVAALAAVPGVAAVMPSYIVDAYIEVRGQRQPMRTYSLPTGLNALELLEGRLPEGPGECAVERRLMREGGYALGGTLSIAPDGSAGYGQAFECMDLTVTGVVSSPLYITMERGRTALGSGTLRYYAYLHPDGYALGAYTDVYVSMEESLGIYNVSDEYDAAARRWVAALAEAGDARAAAAGEAPAGAGSEDPGMGPSSASGPAWSYQTREDGVSFRSYRQDTFRLQKVGYVFPLVFFLVSLLVSLTTMTRMVEEHRTRIGVFKALGYGSSSVALMYASYAAASAALGGAAGVFLGSGLFPSIIADAYGHLYSMPPIETPVPVGIAAAAMAASVSVVVGATLAACLNVTRSEPADLIRPKAPKAGRKVWLEMLPPVWRRVGFIGKITARNIFRFKRRFFMTLTGVAGCAALLLTGFGLRDSLAVVSMRQFGEVEVYDAKAYLSGAADGAVRASLGALTHGEALYAREEAVEVEVGGQRFSASLITPEDYGRLGGFVRLFSPHTGGAYADPPEGALLTEKMARTLGVGEGDVVTLRLGGGAEVEVAVAGVAENYLFHYAFLGPGAYAALFGAEPVPNCLFINGAYDAEALMREGSVLALSAMTDQRRVMADSTDAMGVVTVVLIVLACALAFVVLFNLTLINITERRRELATIKVLGFQDAETALYTYRESMAVTLMGIAVGIAAGILLVGFVLTSVEIDILKFPHYVSLGSYLTAIAVSMAFTVFVSAATYGRLTSIDMVESLKGVE
ncbi:MAG: ABC transporter permease [Oscillospiraceae bacterium]|nr:ABC transporter permease [Oscillospiraceae bacterium]